MKPTWGGSRKNAGRKPSGRKAYLIRMRPKTHKALVRTAKPKAIGAWLDVNVSQLAKLRDIARARCDMESTIANAKRWGLI